MPTTKVAKKKKPPKAGQSVVLRRNQTAQPSKFGQRLSSLLVPAPSLLLLYHIEKTGGSSVFRWLQRQMREPPRLSALFAYGQTSCFFAMHADLFPQMAPQWRAKMCGGEVMPDWRTARVAIQFHAYSKGFFNDHLIPALPQLRARYAAQGGRVITTTTLREPASYLFSRYIMWPPQDRRTGHVMPLPQWLPQAEGLQRTALLKAGIRAHKPGCAGLEFSRQRLRDQQGRSAHGSRSSCMRPRTTATETRPPARSRRAAPPWAGGDRSGRLEAEGRLLSGWRALASALLPALQSSAPTPLGSALQAHV